MNTLETLVIQGVQPFVNSNINTFLGYVTSILKRLRRSLKLGDLENV